MLNDTRLQFAGAAYARGIGSGQRIFNDKLPLPRGWSAIG
jgi:hypothetical protein